MLTKKAKRLLGLWGAGLGLIGAALFYRHFYFSFPMGEGPAGPEVEKAVFAKVWTTRPVLFVGLGDSVTDGYGARKGYGYFDLLAKNPEDESEHMKGICLEKVFPKMKTLNLAISGSTSREALEAELPRLPLAGAETLGVVVITTGGNDVVHNYGRTPPREDAMYGATLAEAQPWIENYRQRLDAILSGVEKQFPGGCQIFIANIFDPTDGEGDISRVGLPAWKEGLQVLAAYNEVIAQCGRKHPDVHVVDMRGGFLGHGIHCAQFWDAHYDAKDPHYWYFTNLEDPNERGYDAIRRMFLREMAKSADKMR